MGSEARFQIFNGIVAGNCTFYPGYIKSTGEFVSPHLSVPLYVNHDNFGGNQGADAKRRLSSLFELTIWGDKPCAVGSHWFTNGKKLSIRGRIESKKLGVKDNSGNLVLQISSGLEKDPVTQQQFQRGMQIPIFRWRYSFTIERFHFGEDSAEANRNKPQGWNVEGSQGYINWQDYIRQVQASQAAGYQGGDTFGLAKVGRVAGQLARKDASGQIIPIGTAVNMASGQQGGQGMYQAQGQPGVGGQPVQGQGQGQGQGGGAPFIQNANMMPAGGFNHNAQPNVQHPPNMGMPVQIMTPVTGQPGGQPGGQPIQRQFTQGMAQPGGMAGGSWAVNDQFPNGVAGQGGGTYANM